jgi:hypothetical protein
MNSESDVYSLRSSSAVNPPGVVIDLPGDIAEVVARHYRLNRLPADGKVQLDCQGNISSVGTNGTFDMPESLLSRDGVYFNCIRIMITMHLLNNSNRYNGRKTAILSSHGVLTISRPEANNMLKRHLPVPVSPMARHLSE